MCSSDLIWHLLTGPNSRGNELKGSEFFEVEDIAPFFTEADLGEGEMVGGFEPGEVGGDAFDAGDGVGEEGEARGGAEFADEDEAGAGGDGWGGEAEGFVGFDDANGEAEEVNGAWAGEEVDPAGLDHALNLGGVEGELAASEADDEVAGGPWEEEGIHDRGLNCY